MGRKFMIPPGGGTYKTHGLSFFHKLSGSGRFSGRFSPVISAALATASGTAGAGSFSIAPAGSDSGPPRQGLFAVQAIPRIGAGLPLPEIGNHSQSKVCRHSREGGNPVRSSALMQGTGFPPSRERRCRH